MTKDKKQQSWVKKAVVGTFVSVPFISSIISTIHLINLFDLGNATPMSIALAIAFELGSVAAFLVPAVLPSIKKGLVYTIFIILAAMQIIGNVFSSYDFIFEKVKAVPSWLDSFMAFISNFGTFAVPEVTLYLSLLIGLPIPLIALFFLKSWMDYLHIEDGEEQTEVSKPFVPRGPDDMDPNHPDYGKWSEMARGATGVQGPTGIETPEDTPKPIRIMSDTQVPGSGIVGEDFTKKIEENLIDIDPKYTDLINENFWELLNNEEEENIEEPLAVDSVVLPGLEDGKTDKEESGEVQGTGDIIPQGVIDGPKESEISELIEPDSEVAILQNNNLR